MICGQIIYMNQLSKKLLYVNGCSFTAGNSLPEEEIWPVLVSKELNLELINDSVNGNSFSTIFTTTISKISQMPNYKDLLVIIGTTWPPRYGVFFEEGMVNISPGDVKNPKSKKIFTEKFNSNRRLSSPYFSDMNKILELEEKIDLRQELFNKTLYNYSLFYKNLVSSDSNLENNQNLDFITKLIALQSFFKALNIDYLIADFARIPQISTINLKNTKLSFENKLDLSKIIPFYGKDFRDKYIDKNTSHPSSKGAQYVSKKLIEVLNG